MDKSLSYAKLALSSSTALLAAQWIMAVISIPSSQDYANQIDQGKSPQDIVTLYDNLSLLITVAIIWAWISTNRFLNPIYLEEVQANPESIRLKKGWVTWGWLVPIVSFWYPKRIVDDLLNAKAKRTGKVNPIGKASGTWWATWISFVLINDLGALNAITGVADPIQPAYELAAAAMLTASYLGWTKILKALAE